MIVDILLPRRTFEPTLYALKEPLELAGVRVPDGFVTDGASVPRLLWWLFPPVGRYFLAAAVHDYLLDSGYNWRYANKKFAEALYVQGVSPWVRWSMFSAVQVYQFVKQEILRYER